MDPLDSRSYLPTNSSLRRVPSHQGPRAMEIFALRLTLTAPSNQPSFGEIGINRNLVENDVEVLRPTQTLNPTIPWQRINETFHEAT